jgi:hypothetical protein
MICGVTMAVGGGGVVGVVGISLVGDSEGGILVVTVVVSVLVEVVYVAPNPLNSDVPSVISSTVRIFPTEE